MKSAEDLARDTLWTYAGDCVTSDDANALASALREYGEGIAVRQREACALAAGSVQQGPSYQMATRIYNAVAEAPLVTDDT